MIDWTNGMNLPNLYISIELLGWCYVTLALKKAGSKPECSAHSTMRRQRGVGRIIIALVAFTVATIYALLDGYDMLVILSFFAYSLAWLRFESHQDKKKATFAGRNQCPGRRTI